MKVNFTTVKLATKFPYPYEMPNRRDFEYAELYCYTMSSFGDDSYWEIEDLHFDSYWEDGESIKASMEWKDE